MLNKCFAWQNRMRDEIQEAMQKDAYYGTQAQHAEEDVEAYRTRAKDWEAEEKQNRKDVKDWEDVMPCSVSLLACLPLICRDRAHSPPARCPRPTPCRLETRV